MRLKEITDNGKIEDIAKTVIRDCSPFLRQIDYNLLEYPLMRGLSKPTVFAKIQANLSDRKPTGTSNNFHTEANKWFTTHYGHPYRNGVFTTGDPRVASSYGYLYYVFPIGDFDFLWSPAIHDLYEDLTGYFDHGEDPRELWAKTYKKLTGNEIDSEAPDSAEEIEKTVSLTDVLDYIDSKLAPFNDTDLKSGIKARTEIMLWVKNYYIFEYDLTNIKQLQAAISKLV